MVEESVQTVTLGKQLAASGGMMLVMTIVHALGLTGISKLLNLRKERLKEMDFSFRSISVLSGMGLLLLVLHTVEIGIFAAFYLLIDAMQTVEEALYYSASTYATLGRTADYFPADWRLMGAIEALIGFLLIGWSTAFIVSKVNRLMPG
ncbi:MAG: two pore domain potassium channel family protein [Alphaproteobacteria bacterium]|nr:two pore domain potassium channel family protein [Alphaproteobacteria bacterium]MBU2272331.1 two pore domain potassium channel family protein [Alphaproteobacteria bacterium]MBU2419448.1 two pore domain potassium channel family protein [Alphaproteobacteria bacterium]